MKLTRLTAISPIDGRYGEKLAELQPIFSEFGLIYHRVFVEIHWLLMLAEKKQIPEISNLSESAKKYLQNIITQFSEKDAEQIKIIEKTTNHDVKAVEYFIKEKLATHNELSHIKEFVHFACTSEDINNLAYGLMLKQAQQQCLSPQIKKLISKIGNLAHNLADMPMLSHTHGQPATPTTMGKELANFAARLQLQNAQLKYIKISGKFNGAVGNYSAHYIAYPDIDWLTISKKFVENLDLSWNPYTTQIDPHDTIAELCHAMMRFNTILIDFVRDVWHYTSLNYFQQKPKEQEIGSSTMPHKVNPIDFENAEGNLGVSNALLQHFANKLPCSRMQRDLTDSTVLRNLGVGFAHSLLAYQAILHGLEKLTINLTSMIKELEQHWEILAEPLQTIMRRYNIEGPYEKLKTLTRGKTVTKQTIQSFIDTLNIPDHEKERLKKLTPENYLGKAEKLAKSV